METLLWQTPATTPFGKSPLLAQTGSRARFRFRHRCKVPILLPWTRGGQFIFVRTTALATAKQSRFIDRIDFRTLFSWLGVRERQAALTGPIATLGLDFRVGSPPILRPTSMSLTGGI